MAVALEPDYREIDLIGSISQRMEDFQQANALAKQRPALLDAIQVEMVP